MLKVIDRARAVGKKYDFLIEDCTVLFASSIKHALKLKFSHGDHNVYSHSCMGGWGGSTFSFSGTGMIPALTLTIYEKNGVYQSKIARLAIKHVEKHGRAATVGVFMWDLGKFLSRALNSGGVPIQGEVKDCEDKQTTISFTLKAWPSVDVDKSLSNGFSSASSRENSVSYSSRSLNKRGSLSFSGQQSDREADESISAPHMRSYGEPLEALDNAGLCVRSVPLALVALCEYFRAHSYLLADDPFRSVADEAELADVVRTLNTTDDFSALDLASHPASALAEAITKFIRELPARLVPEPCFTQVY
jgi:hypothetical protein